jgi:hypothetical protein
LERDTFKRITNHSLSLYYTTSRRITQYKYAKFDKKNKPLQGFWRFSYRSTVKNPVPSRYILTGIANPAKLRDLLEELLKNKV